MSLALAFTIVRLIYGCAVILGNASPSIWFYLATGVIMEFIICFIVELVGFTLRKIPQYEQSKYGIESAKMGSANRTGEGRF